MNSTAWDASKIGAAANNIDVQMTGLQQADYGWLAVLGVVVAVEVAGSRREQMLSHASVRYQAAHPVVTTGVVLTTAAHLLGWLPADVDPFHRTYAALRLLRRQRIHAAAAVSATAMSGTRVSRFDMPVGVPAR